MTDQSESITKGGGSIFALIFIVFFIIGWNSSLPFLLVIGFGSVLGAAAEITLYSYSKKKNDKEEVRRQKYYRDSERRNEEEFFRRQKKEKEEGLRLQKKEEEEELRQTIIKDKRIESACNQIESIVRLHLKVLVRKRRSLVRIGDYGEIIDDAWKKELNRFFEVTITQDVYDLMALEEKVAKPILEDFVDGIVYDNLEQFSDTVDEIDVSDLDGIEYEQYCEELLERNGWVVTRTPSTGDHGVDLLAEKDGRSVAIQCKRYSSPVGNKAVQEVYSGMAFYDAQEAVVVSNAQFTLSAKEVANKLSVRLNHHDQLAEL